MSKKNKITEESGEQNLHEVLSRPVGVVKLSNGGERLIIALDDEERRRIEEFLKLEEVKTFKAELHLVPLKHHEFRLTGVVKADVVHSCVLTNEPVPQKVSEEVDVTLVRANEVDRYMETVDKDGSLVLDIESDPPDPFEGDFIDLGAYALEFLSLGLDPYPRAQDAEFSEGDDPSDVRENPFEVLSQIKARMNPN